MSLLCKKISQNPPSSGQIRLKERLNNCNLLFKYLLVNRSTKRANGFSTFDKNIASKQHFSETKGYNFV